MDNYSLPFDCIKDRNVCNKTISQGEEDEALGRRWSVFSPDCAGDVRVMSNCQA